MPSLMKLDGFQITNCYTTTPDRICSESIEGYYVSGIECKPVLIL